MRNSGTELVERLVLDTSAYSNFRRGHEIVLDFMAGAGLILLPTTALGELEAGFELGTRKKENRVLLSQFLDEPFVSILPVTHAVARRYGQIFAQLRRVGTPIPINDIWIAASAMDCGGHLLTFDQDYQQVEALDCTILEL
jgi:tRNA(fMet)-specific endonuclease VapC